MGCAEGGGVRGSLNSQTKCNTCIECCHGKCISAPHPWERCQLAGLRDQGLSKRQIAAKLDRSPSTISRELNRNSFAKMATGPATPTTRPGPGAGAVPSWTETPPCATPSTPASREAGPRNRWPVAWLWKPAAPSSPTRPSTASSRPKSTAARTIPGATCCPAARPNGAAGVARAAVPLPLSAIVSTSPSAQSKPTTALLPATGKPT